MQVENNAMKKKHDFVSLLLPWIQILHIYAFISGITLGYLVIVAIDVLLIFRPGSRIVLDLNGKWCIAFFVFSILSLPFCLYFADSIAEVSIANRIVKLAILYLLFLLCSSRGINWKDYVLSLRIISIISCAVIVVQFVMYLSFGYYFSINVPFLKYANESTDTYLKNHTTESRFHSIFTEPAHFVFFIVQYLIVLLFNSDTFTLKRLGAAIIVTICVLLSVSTTGIVLLAVIWVCFFVTVAFKRKQKRETIMFLFLALVIVLLVFVFFNNSILFQSFSRMGGGFSTSNTVWKRIYANVDVVRQTEGFTRWFGRGLGNVESTFMNSFVYLLINNGIIGAVLVFVWFVRCFFASSRMGRIAIICLFLLAAIDMVLFTPTVLGYLIIILQSNQKAEKKDPENEECSIYCG